MRLLIVNNNLQIGGVQKALINLLWQIAERHQVTLLLFCGAGPLREQLPPGVQVQNLSSWYRFLGMTKTDVKTAGDALGRSFFAVVTRLCGRRWAVRLMALSQKTLGPYDAAVSYLHDAGDRVFYGGCNEFVLRHVQAKQKIAFLHCDYAACGADTPRNAAQYAKFDVIAACSQGCAEVFRRAQPQLAEKLRVVPNCHGFSHLRHTAAAPLSGRRELVVITAARLSREKSVGRALEALAALGDDAARIRYYIVGDGCERKRLEAQAKALGLQETVIFCGEQREPYGLIKAADLLLLPSVSEAAPLVVGEAACLGTPVLCTRTSSAQELIDRYGCGWVCDNSVQGICRSLSDLVRSPQLLAQKRMQLAVRSFEDAQAVQCFERLLQETETFDES